MQEDLLYRILFERIPNSPVEKVVEKLATQTRTSTAAAPKMTGMRVAGIVGVIGGVLAAL